MGNLFARLDRIEKALGLPPLPDDYEPPSPRLFQVLFAEVSDTDEDLGRGADSQIACGGRNALDQSDPLILAQQRTNQLVNEKKCDVSAD